MNLKQFDQFEDYAGALVHADLRLMLPRLDRAHWEIATQSVGNIEFQFGKEGSGIIAEGAVHQGGQTLFVPMTGQQFANGHALDDQKVLLLAPGGELNIASHVPHDWCSVVLPFDMSHYHSSGCHEPYIRCSGSQVIDVGHVAMSRIRGMLTQLYDSFRREPNLSSQPAAQKSIGSDLRAVLKPLEQDGHEPKLKMGRPQIDRRRVINCIMDRINKASGEVFSIEDLTRAANISERSLRNIFLDYFGVPPGRFLTVRRLHQVRSELRTQMSESTSVTEVAGRFGFWHFGRFAKEYRRLFGELPSQTLHGTGKRQSSQEDKVLNDCRRS